MSDKEGKVHFLIKKKDGVSDYTGCDRALSYLDPATVVEDKVTCKPCRRAIAALKGE